MPMKIKALWIRHRDAILNVFIVVLVALLAFAIGRLSVIYGDTGGVEIRYKDALESGLPPQVSTESYLVGSRTGSAYHFPWCPGALTMKPENKIYFAAREEAESKGYRPAGNCRGL